MKPRRRTQQRAAQGIIFYLVGALIGAIIGAFGVSALTNREESSERTATVYSTTGAENWEYSGTDMQYDETACKLSFNDRSGATHTVYTLGYIVEVTER